MVITSVLGPSREADTDGDFGAYAARLPDFVGDRQHDDVGCPEW